MDFILSESLVDNVKAIVDKDIPLVSNLSNFSRLIYDSIPNTSWCGFYLSFKDKDELYLGPYQGPIACTLIKYGRGVCGTCALEKKTQLVPNVHECKNHIACSSKTNSEIVVPIIKDDVVVGVIDLDSEEFDNFTLEHQRILEEVSDIIKDLF